MLKPLGMEAAVKAIEAQSGETTAAEQLELSLQQARYEVAHARRQYDAVDPTNRLGYVRRDAEGHFTNRQVDVGRSLAVDRRSKSKTVAKKGEGDRGDQKRR